MGRVDGGLQHGGLGLRGFLAEVHGRGHVRLHLGAEGLQAAHQGAPTGGDARLQALERVALLPACHVLLRARLDEVGAHAVLAPAPRQRLDQRRAVAGAGAGHGLAHGGMHLQHVVAVDAHAGNVVGRGPVGDLLHRRGLPVGGVERVLVVLAEEDHRQLPHRGDVEGLVEEPLVLGTVPEERDHHPVGLPQALRQRGAGAQGQRGADDAVGAQDAQGQVGDVHGAAQAPAIAGLAAHQLGHHALQVRALGDAVAVAAVVAADVVVRAQVGAGPRGDGLLADVAVRGALHVARLEQLGRVLLEAADAVHGAVQFQQQGRVGLLRLGSAACRGFGHGGSPQGVWLAGTPV